MIIIFKSASIGLMKAIIEVVFYAQRNFSDLTVECKVVEKTELEYSSTY